ncbi:MAG: glycosyltransferase family 4 protein [Chloroflexi bacterium]|nr:MAG: glycosyltransferase family 4 protein [Chloroflexota bacterium]
MRLLFVVQRYGQEVFGGAEACCREFATRLAARGHQVHVVTSRARNYSDWANEYPEGEQDLDGVTVHRLSVSRPRHAEVFDGLQRRTVAAHHWTAAHLQTEWMRQQGPLIDELPGWLADMSPGFDITIFFTYLYYTTWAGLRAVRTPSVLHPTAHDEPPAYLPLFDEVFRLPSALAFLTAEEGEFVRRRFRVRQPSMVIGIGMEARPPTGTGEFRRRFGIDDAPYLACVGRTDPGKGSLELFEFFTAYQRRRRSPLKLALIGEEVFPLPSHPDVVKTGFVDEDVRDAGIAGATLLVQPSFFESFSMVLTEAWSFGVPALVQGRSEVLVGQARRSGGGLPYCGYAEFEAALDLLLADDELRRRLGSAGRAHVESTYSWDAVFARYFTLLGRAVERRWVPPGLGVAAAASEAAAPPS